MKYFGTDGVRGRVGEHPMTAEFVLQFGWAVGTVLGQPQAPRPVVIGKDTRISGYLFESALEAGLSAAGANSILLGPMPTPAVAHLTHSLDAAAGIVISASHNPHHDNGLKLFSASGEKVDEALQVEIEQKLDEGLSRGMTMVQAQSLGKALRMDDAVGRYIEFCKATIEPDTTLTGLKCVLDCANGATYRIAPEVFRELGCEVVAIHDQPDGLNINADCGSTHPQRLSEAVVAHGADVGMAFDGDGDRVVLVDHTGEVVDGDQIVYLLALSRHRAGQLHGGVVGTVMSNLGLAQALEANGIAFERTRVGDRYVHEALQRNGWTLGGEASGHILCLDQSRTGCGIVSALQVCQQLVQQQRSLADLVKGMVKYPQTMVNVPIQAPGQGDIEAVPEIATALTDAQRKLGEHGRVVLRPSGTEPVVRVMVEGEDSQQIEAVAAELASVVARAI